MMLRMHRNRVIIALALAAAAVGARADVYRIVDSQGHVQYTDRWEPGAVLIKTEHPRSSTESSADDQKRATAEGDRISEQLSREQAERAVKADQDKVRSEQCKSAKERYRKAIESRRLYREGKNGEREYLTDDQAQQERVDARQEVQAACGSDAGLESP